MLTDNTITAQKVKQNNLEFFVSIFTISQILKFTKYTERLIVSYDGENHPIYNNEIQRKVETSRVDKISDFLINNPDALFPTNLVISIPNAVIEKIEPHLNHKIYSIELSDKVFDEIKKDNGDVFLTIIDGQHRIKGIEKAIDSLYNEISNLNKVLANSTNKELIARREKAQKLLDNLLNIDLIVSFFIDPTLEFQAMVFSTINRTQKSVPQSLVYSLFGLTENDSPQKTALQIVLALNGYEKSPFYDRIKLYGGTYGRGESPPLTQAMMVKSIIDLICTNSREAENDRFRKRKDLIKFINRDLPFRKFYAQDKDNAISDILFSYFSAVRICFTSDGKPLWDFDGEDKTVNVLQTTIGYQALLDLLKDILDRIQDTEKDQVQVYQSHLVKANRLNFADTSRYPFTSKSRKILYLDLSLAIFPASDTSDDRLVRLKDFLNDDGF